MFENPEEAFGGTARLLELIETIYAAVQQPALWISVMDRIAEAVHGESTILFTRFPQNSVLSMARMDPVAWDAYVTYYASVNVLMKRCDELFPDGAVRYGDRAMPESQLVPTEFYNDFFKPNNMHHSFGLKVPLGDIPAAYISCQRPKSSGPFTEREGRVYETLRPHLQRAFGLYLTFTRMQSCVLGLETSLDAFDHAVFGLDGQGRVVFSNTRAEAIAQAADAIRLVGRRLCAVFPEQNRHLERVLAEAVDAGTGIGISSGASLLLDSKNGENPLQMTVSPFRSSMPGTSAQLAAIVFLSDPASRAQSKGAILRALYGLTPTEARVADLLLQGLEVRDVSHRLAIKLETARFHTKRVLSKTRTRRQTELMRLMLSLPQV